MLRLSTLLCFLFFGGLLAAQGVRGTITDEAGQALEFATIYVQEDGSGAVANDDGAYEVRLIPGDYTLIFQHLGHETVIRKITVGDRMKTENIQMKAQALELMTVDLYEGREDPAYTVMRKAIAKADYHRQQVEHYTAEVYIKGSGRLLKSPGLLRKMIEREGVDSTVAFTTEQISEIEYQRPNTFTEKVISVYSVGDDQGVDANGYIFGSFYEAEVGSSISPLSPKAFAYYKFEYEGFFLDRGYGVNKIKVIPRSRGDQVFFGSIYIVEDDWSIYRTDLTTRQYGITFKVNQVYAPIDDKAWLPTSQNFDITGKVFGFAFEYNYVANVKNYDITLNPDLPKDMVVIDEKINAELAAQVDAARAKDQEMTDDPLAKLSQGEEVTRKELRKILRDYEKEERKEREEPLVESNYNYSIDSLANKRDSTYWEAVRPLPLTKYEIAGYERIDSLQQIKKAKQEAAEDEGEGMTKSKKKKEGFKAWYLATGYTHKLGEHQRFSHAPLWTGFTFNPVEGFALAPELKYRAGDKKRLYLTATPRYSFARDKWRWKSELAYRFDVKKRRQYVRLRGGFYPFQFNENTAIHPLVNAYTNLVQERNFIRLFEKEFLQARAELNLKDNLQAQVKLEHAKRHFLENTTTQTFFPRDNRFYSSNIPNNLEWTGPVAEPEVASIAEVSLQAQPWQRYRIRNGNKELIEDSSPTIGLTYTKGFKNLLKSDVDFDHIQASFRHRWKLGIRGRLGLNAYAGTFFNNKAVGFTDYRHFSGNQLSITTADPISSYRLLPYYINSTADSYAGAHAYYQFRKFLVTRIFEVQMMGIRENVFVNNLYTPTAGNYTEVGYVIDNIFRVLRIEAAFSFRDGKYQDWGILIGVSSAIGNSVSVDVGGD